MILFAGLMSIIFLTTNDLRIAAIAAVSILVSVMSSFVVRNLIELENKNKLEKVIEDFLKIKSSEEQNGNKPRTG
jgi:hypothetical protein